MMTSSKPCNPPKTNTGTKWPHEEYYLGERDEENRKNGKGSHYWSGAEFLESYDGHMLRDTMHGNGDYRWRYLGPGHLAATYEGQFYSNSMHGYGLMSYPNGCVFNGLFHKNSRWGPGVETHACLLENVGLWYGHQLIRLAWRPEVPSVAIDLMSTPIGANTVTPHRILLTENVKIIGEVNSALELLKQSGCEPLAAAEKWSKLYPKNCTDLSSQLCQVDAFDRAYYGNGINTLNEVTAAERDKDSSSEINDPDKTTYYAWNNNKIIIHMMKHSFTHEEQRGKHRLNLEHILSGPRSYFKKPGKHEMDCRTLMMSSYLGDITSVATLINECDVLADVTDVQGNSVIMYAACGAQPEIIHFLVEAGAEVDTYNDACCTPLGITLLRYVLEKRGVAHNATLQALLPPPTVVGPPPPDVNILEWQICRGSRTIPAAIELNTVKSNNKPTVLTKKPSAKDLSTKKKTEGTQADLQKVADKDINANTDTFAEDKQMYDSINTKYLIRVAEAFSELSEVHPIPYIFEVNDMYKDVELLNEEETKKIPDKPLKKTVSKINKELPTKPSRDTLFQDKEDTLVDTMQQKKQEKMSRIMLTILQLLSEGADPLKVRCPQPPLFIAAVSGCAELIEHLFMNGADINEVYPQVYGYSTLAVAVSGPLTNDNLEVIRALLECGADPDIRLKVPPQSIPPTTPPAQPPDIMPEVEGPTLLHAVLARKIDVEADPRLFDLRARLLELILQYGCNPMTQYKGRSAVDVALQKSLDLFDIFLKSPRTDLNAVINDSNQTILVKMFYLPFWKTIPLSEKLQTLTTLLLFGADPLIKCQNGKDEYGNLFVFAKSVLTEMDSYGSKSPSQTTSKNPKHLKSEIKTKKASKTVLSKSAGTKAATTKQVGKIPDDSQGDYRQTIDLVVECARLLYIRWLQGTLMKELIEVVYKTKILRCTSITKVWRSPPITFQEKEFIENEVAALMRNHRLATMSVPDMVPTIRPYVRPELMLKEEEKFNVCFECIMPLGGVKIPCDSCNLIGFCSFECMKTNIDRFNCHPCSNYLKAKYFPTPEETVTNSEDINII